MRAARTPHARSAAPAARLTLAVSGIAVRLRQPTGAEDLLLAEHRVEDPALALALVQRLGLAEPAVVWADLPVPDIDALIVRMRQALVGDRVAAVVTCVDPSCGQRIDLSFSLDAYLAHRRPSPMAGRRWPVTPDADSPFWYVLPSPDGAQARFRLPTLADQIAVNGLPDPVAALARRCVRPDGLPGRIRARVEAAMAKLAPPLAGPLEGRCPDCATPIAARFEARLYCLQELREHARFVFDDVDTLAERYHWSERDILTLPHVRRASYADRARRALPA